ncbi:RuBisCO large subunit-binding protein subunit alpha [Musa troglodytarum]|uniref:RuBisCO large subunit-binding protein subunit alpha n=1 Tax=Musa troglodytarum TaxID=320322 RepID=A0A9E7HRQ3_9LILI|nr:RuBisCO large subunit-binding protein subunit alpha [Musa troglodytarum]
MVVRASAKEIAFGQSSRSFLQAGIEKLADAVGVTLGPRGTFVSALSPRMFWWRVRSMTPRVMGRQLHLSLLARSKLVQELEKKAMPVKGRGDIKGYISPQFVANIEKLILEFENAKISVTDQKISTIKEIIPFLEKMTQLGALLLIIAEDVTGRGLATPAIENVSVGQLGTARIFTVSQTFTTIISDAATNDEIQDRACKECHFCSDRGGGAAYVHLSATLPIVKEKLEDHDELLGADIEQKALVAPAALVARNAETEGEDQGQRIGAIEPAKVTRCALQNAVHQQLEWSLQHGRMWRRSPRKKSPPPPLMMMMMAWFSHLNE